MNPSYSTQCRHAVDSLLTVGGSLTSYRANIVAGVGPAKQSWAWELERQIEHRFEVKHAIVTSSGTAALHVALVALGIQGKEVVCSPITFSATIAAVVLAGARPVFADVHPRTALITAATVKRVLTKKTGAILPVHLFGQMVDVQGLKAFGLPIIEDAAQAVGCRSSQGYAGSLGLAGIYSFVATKQVPAGEGGCITTNDMAMAHRARLLINHAENFGADFVGYNYRLNEVSACIAFHGLQALKDNTPFAYPYLVKRRGKNDRPYIDKHLGHMPVFKQYMKGPLPVADKLCKRVLCVRYSV